VGPRDRVLQHVLRNENVVALCDVNDLRTKEALKMFPQGEDLLGLAAVLDQKDVEAVIICTADHHHAFIANWALNRDMHVFCEKPLGISVEEARVVRANYLKRRAKVATQHGTQRHAYPNFERMRELILDGAIGELKTVHSWDSRQLAEAGVSGSGRQPPPGFHYEQWIGPSPYHPYSPQYFGGSSGLNCLFWNMYRDFGVGQMGDMGAHTMDLVWNAVDAGGPIAVDVDHEVSDKFDPGHLPGEVEGDFRASANKWRGPIQVVWYQGGLKPEAPKNYIDVERIGNGAIFEGTKGAILADFTTPADHPQQRRRRLHVLQAPGRTSFCRWWPEPDSPRRLPAASRRQARASRRPAGRQALPPGFTAMPSAQPGRPGSRWSSSMKGRSRPRWACRTPPWMRRRKPSRAARPARIDPFQTDWINACKGRSDNVVHGTSSKTHCDFDYSGTMIEQMLLGLVAHRREAAGVRSGHRPRDERSEANDYLKRTYRPTGR
jgi:predicted dehydrogenase